MDEDTFIKTLDKLCEAVEYDGCKYCIRRKDCGARIDYGVTFCDRFLHDENLDEE